MSEEIKDHGAGGETLMQRAMSALHAIGLVVETMHKRLGAVEARCQKADSAVQGLSLRLAGVEDAIDATNASAADVPESTTIKDVIATVDRAAAPSPLFSQPLTAMTPKFI
ncbi:MAG: hypothetical protein JO234_04250, partial [Hyphomicrobiales bacterium]|nr:hypothetical protein [Hyphomicrobiales bacterium]